MNQPIYSDINRRHDFVLLFDVTDGNPNGDPDAGNLPRVDPETMHGLVTDVCLKRKVRDWVDAAHGTEERFKIYVQWLSYLYDQQARAFTALGLDRKDTKKIGETRRWMCENFYDIRMFGAVMSTTDYNCGQVRGPVQMTFARSLDPIVPLDLAITRVAVTRREDAEIIEGESGEAEGRGKTTEMGRKALVPYGLYRGHGFFNPHFGQQTGISQEDLALFWQALQQMWDLDRSASRGLMACRGLYVFSHESALGNAPAHRLFERVSVRLKDGVSVPRHFTDYEVTLDDQDLPGGVTLMRPVD